MTINDEDDTYTHHHRRSSDPVVVTTRDIYDIALETRSSVQNLVALHGASQQVQLDHEQRLRSIERWRYALPTALLLSGFASLATLALYAVERVAQ